MKLLLRNAAIGAAFLSYRALFYREYGFFALLCGLGALSGVLYTLLEPLFRNRPRLHYLPWILCAYLADRKSTRLNSSHLVISYAVFCLKKKKQKKTRVQSHR